MNKKCSCGCELITSKEDGGKMTSTCACKCGGKIKPKKHEHGGQIQKFSEGGYYGNLNPQEIQERAKLPGEINYIEDYFRKWQDPYANIKSSELQKKQQLAISNSDSGYAGSEYKKALQHRAMRDYFLKNDRAYQAKAHPVYTRPAVSVGSNPANRLPEQSVVGHTKSVPENVIEKTKHTFTPDQQRV